MADPKEMPAMAGAVMQSPIRIEDDEAANGRRSTAADAVS
jgi:hypothetical protein